MSMLTALIFATALAAPAADAAKPTKKASDKMIRDGLNTAGPAVDRCLERYLAENPDQKGSAAWM